MMAVVDAAVTSVGRVRFSIVAMLFAVTMVNYADPRSRSPALLYRSTLVSMRCRWASSSRHSDRPM
jgi:hypothetical protein